MFPSVLGSIQGASVSWSSKVMRSSSRIWSAAPRACPTVPSALTAPVRSADNHVLRPRLKNTLMPSFIDCVVFQNGGMCQDSEASLYKCSCPRGFTGSNCQHHSSLHCHPEACGPDATCINRQNSLGYDCRCHLGKSGNKCMDGKGISLFSFAMSPPRVGKPLPTRRW